MKYSKNTKTYRHLLKILKTINNPTHHPHIKLATYIYHISKQLDAYKHKTNKQLNHLRKQMDDCSRRSRLTKNASIKIVLGSEGDIKCMNSIDIFYDPPFFILFVLSKLF